MASQSDLDQSISETQAVQYGQDIKKNRRACPHIQTVINTMNQQGVRATYDGFENPLLRCQICPQVRWLDYDETNKTTNSTKPPMTLL